MIFQLNITPLRYVSSLQLLSQLTLCEKHLLEPLNVNWKCPIYSEMLLVIFITHDQNEANEAVIFVWENFVSAHILMLIEVSIPIRSADVAGDQGCQNSCKMQASEADHVTLCCILPLH